MVARDVTAAGLIASGRRVPFSRETRLGAAGACPSSYTYATVANEHVASTNKQQAHATYLACTDFESRVFSR